MSKRWGWREARAPLDSVSMADFVREFLSERCAGELYGDLRVILNTPAFEVAEAVSFCGGGLLNQQVLKTC